MPVLLGFVGLNTDLEVAGRDQSSTRRNRKALPMTDTELKLIAAAAIIGLSRRPKKG